MTAESKTLRIGPICDGQPWPRGGCVDCGGECDGAECGLHAAGCVFGGPFGAGYWLIADGCPLWHGSDRTYPETEKLNEAETVAGWRGV